MAIPCEKAADIEVLMNEVWHLREYDRKQNGDLREFKEEFFKYKEEQSKDKDRIYNKIEAVDQKVTKIKDNITYGVAIIVIAQVILQLVMRVLKL